LSETRLTQKTQAWIEYLLAHRSVFQQLWARPRKWVYLVDMVPEKWAKSILGFASGVYDPHLLGKGLVVEVWEPTRVGLKLSKKALIKEWFDLKGATNGTALSELALRLYWEWQMGPGSFEFHVDEIQWKKLQEGVSPLKARYHVDSHLRDQYLFQLQSEGLAIFEAEVNLLDEEDRIVNRVTAQIKLVGPRGFLPLRGE